MSPEVLVVEDEDAVRRGLRRILVANGYRTREASDGVSALATARAETPDLVLLDIRLPGMSGIDVARALRRGWVTAQIPILFLTGLDDVDTCVDGFAAGADDFLRKPFAAAELLARVEGILRRGSSRLLTTAARDASRGEEDPPRALLVEDDTTHARAAARALVAAGFTIRAETTAAGFRAAIREEPDLVVLDILLPDGNGLDLLRETRDEPATRDIPVMVTSGLCGVEDRVQGLRAGAQDYIGKPIVAAEFEARARSLGRFGRNLRSLRRSVAKLAEESSLDPKTGLAHYGSLMKRLREEVERSRRSGVPFSLLLLDLDHFKAYNDTLGHAAGDEVLCDVARLLARRVRATDLAARFGGEEFACVLAGARLDEAVRLAEEIRLRVGEELPPGVTISIGAAEFSPADSPESLIERADRALYRAKKRGRDRVETAA